MITKLSDLVVEARSRGLRRLVVACAADGHTLKAVSDAVAEQLVVPILIGNKSKIEEIAGQENLDIVEYTIVDESDELKALRIAVEYVSTGKADVLMKGLVSTDKYMRAILNREAGLFPQKGTLSHVSVVELPGRDKLLSISDVAVIPLPDFKQKTILVKYLKQVANSLGVKCPKIAAVAPSEQVLPSVISSTEGAVLAKMADRGQLGDVILDGPLSLDVALYADVAEEKHVKGSRVAGDVDCLLFPNIESGNVFFKAATHLGKAEIAAIVVGTNVPCVLTSRGDTPSTKLYSIALACLQVKKD